MSYLINSIIYILLGVVGVACAVKAKEVDLSERQNIKTSHLVEELELLSRINLIEAHKKNSVKGEHSANGTIVSILRGRADNDNRSVFVLAKRTDWSWTGEAYFWVKFKEVDFLKSGFQMDGPIAVSQPANYSPTIEHRDYDLFYSPKIAVAPYVLSQE